MMNLPAPIVHDSTTLTQDDASRIIIESLKNLPGSPPHSQLQFLATHVDRTNNPNQCRTCHSISVVPTDLVFSTNDFIADISLRVCVCETCKFIDYDAPFSLYETAGPEERSYAR